MAPAPSDERHEGSPRAIRAQPLLFRTLPPNVPHSSLQNEFFDRVEAPGGSKEGARR